LARKADRCRQLRRLPAVMRPALRGEAVNAAADDVDPVKALLVRRPDGALADDVAAVENKARGHCEISSSTGAFLMMAVSRRCQAMSRHMPRYWGPQKLEVQIAVQRPLAALLSTPAAQTSFIQSQSAIGQSRYMTDAQASVVTSGLPVARDQAAALPIHSLSKASNLSLLAR